MGAYNLQIKFFTLLAFDLCLSTSSSILSSLFDEKYTLSILDIHDTQTIDFMEQAAQKSVETLTTRSRTGQSFICYLPQAKNINADGSSNVTMRITNADIHSRIKLIEGPTGSLCPILNQGWWTYEFCFGSEITQFHQERDKSSVNNVALSLGVFSHETAWDNQTFTAETIKAQQVSLHHVQHYTNGSKCELTGQSRSTKVRFFCGKVFKIQITEPGTCTYLVTVNTPSLCDLPIFKPEEAETVEKISCIPDVDLSYLRAQKVKTESKSMASMEDKENVPIEGISGNEAKGSASSDENEGMGSESGREGEISKEINSGISEEKLDDDSDDVLTPQSQPSHSDDEEAGAESSSQSTMTNKETPKIPPIKPFQKEPEVITTSQLKNRMDSLSNEFAAIYGEDNSQTLFDDGKKQSKKVSLSERFMEEIVSVKRTKVESESKVKTPLGELIEKAQTIENEVVVYVDRLGDMIAKSEVPALLLTDLKYTLRTIKTLISDFANRNIHSLYETVLKSPDPLLAKKLESFASPVVEEYVENLGLLSETLTSIEFLVDYYGKFLPMNEDIDMMDFPELKSLYDDIRKQYSMPETIKKEAKAIFNIIETRYPSQNLPVEAQTTEKTNLNQELVSVDNEKDTEIITDDEEKSDEPNSANQKPIDRNSIDPKILKLLRELLKQARQLAFFEETNQMMSSFYSKQNRGRSYSRTKEMKKEETSKSPKKENLETAETQGSNKQPLKSKTTWEDYKNVMLGRDMNSGDGSGKTVIKVKMSQYLGEERRISSEGAEEFTIEIDEGEVLEGIDISDVKEMEVHFLAIGSSEDYAKMTKDPAKLAQLVKEALKTGNSVRFDSDSPKTPQRVLKTEREHFELKSRYWDSYKLNSQEQPLELIDSIKEKIAGMEQSLDESNVKDKTSSASYSRKYHLI